MRLTHNHVTFSVSILRPIILLLLNYIAQIPRKKNWHFVHVNLQLSAFYSTFCSPSHVCVYWSGCVKYSLAKCVNEKSVSRAQCCVFAARFTFFSLQTCWKRGELFERLIHLSSGTCAAIDGEKQFLEEHQFRGMCEYAVFVRQHSK